jgi:hypothetical protein
LNPEKVSGKTFDVKIEIMPDEKERQFLEGMIQTALSAGMIEFEDAFKVRGIKNTKLAEMYLTKAKSNKQKQEMEKARQNSEMNAQSQQQSIQAKAQADAQLQQLEGQSKIAVVSAEMSMKQELSSQEFVQNALMKSFETGKPLTPEIQSIVDNYFAKKEQEAQAQQQAMQEQMSQQQEGQMNEAE